MPLVLERPMRLSSKKLTALLGMRKELLPLYRLLELGVRKRCGDGGEIRIEDDEIIFSDGPITSGYQFQWRSRRTTRCRFFW